MLFVRLGGLAPARPIRDRRPTAWDGFASTAETEVTCIWKVSPQIVVGRFLKVCIVSVE